MKKIWTIILSAVMALSVCACGGGAKTAETTTAAAEETTTVTEGVVAEEANTNEEKIYSIGDTAKTELAEVVLKSVSNDIQYNGIEAEDGSQFVIVNFTIKNIGKKDFGNIYIETGNGQHMSTNDFCYIPAVDYNDGYIFKVESTSIRGTNYGGTAFSNHYEEKLTDLKPLSKAIECEVAILVPNEVVDNKSATLLIRMSVPNTNTTSELVYSVR